MHVYSVSIKSEVKSAIEMRLSTWMVFQCGTKNVEFSLRTAIPILIELMELTIAFSFPLYTGHYLMSTLANSEDREEIRSYSKLFAKTNDLQKKNTIYFFIITSALSKHTKDYSIFCSKPEGTIHQYKKG